MTSKERVLTALASRQPDRVPIDYFANGDIDRRLKAHFGLTPTDDEGLRRALHVDFRGLWAPYAGPKLHADIPERGVKVDDWGIHRMWIEHASGGELLRQVVGKLGRAGGHERRAGGCIPLASTSKSAVDELQAELRRRFLKVFKIEDVRGQRLVPLREMLENLQS